MVVCGDEFNEEPFFNEDDESIKWHSRQLLIINRLSQFNQRYKKLNIMKNTPIEFYLRKQNHFEKICFSENFSLRFADMYFDEICKTNMDCHRTVLYLTTGNKVTTDENIRCRLASTGKSETIQIGQTVSFGFRSTEKMIKFAKSNNKFGNTLMKSFRLNSLEDLEINPEIFLFLHSAIYIGNSSTNEPLYLGKYGPRGAIGVDDIVAIKKYCCYEDLVMLNTELYVK